QYLSAERDLAHQAAPDRQGRGLLIVGGPDFDAGPKASQPGAFRFQPLPGALDEIQDVRASWHSPEIAVLSAGRAAKASFKRPAPGRQVIHTATHGFYAGDRERSDTEENPLLLSGLAFAGANRAERSPGDGGDGGILTAEEIASLDLRGVEWVVLSSCES